MCSTFIYSAVCYVLTLIINIKFSHPRTPFVVKQKWKINVHWSEKKASKQVEYFRIFNPKLKERYRIGKKQKPWRSQIYIKLTWCNDDDSRKYPLKYFCLKFHIWCEINNLISRLEFIAQERFVHFCFGINAMQNL